MEYVTFELCDLLWDVRRLDPDEQIEVECIMIKTFGPACGAAVAALVQGVAPALIDVLRETTGEGESFDLSRLASLDTSDDRIQGAWDELLDALAETGGDLVRDGLGVFSSRLEHRDIFRLFELAILTRKVMVYARGKEQGKAFITDYRMLGEVLKHNPNAKWKLLFRVLGVTYGSRDHEPVQEPATE